MASILALEPCSLVLLEKGDSWGGVARKVHWIARIVVEVGSSRHHEQRRHKRPTSSGVSSCCLMHPTYQPYGVASKHRPVPFGRNNTPEPHAASSSLVQTSRTHLVLPVRRAEEYGTRGVLRHRRLPGLLPATHRAVSLCSRAGVAGVIALDPSRAPCRWVSGPLGRHHYGTGVPTGAGTMPSWTRRP
jgi:hypothetical protein